MTNQESQNSVSVRPPIVAVLGHVDHGKTSLLDAIRKSNLAAREAGGITQSIGASTILTKDNQQITFIDTPGHAAFSAMRSRGAKVADIIILVVAADDGVKPQTKEALDHILASNAKFLVAFTKIDLPSASIEQAQNSLEALGVFFEGRGGDIPYVAVSSRKGEGIDQLLDLIILMSEVNEIKQDPEKGLEAIVIETSKDKRGQLVSVVVRNGELNIGSSINADGIECKIKGLFNDLNKPVKEVLAGFPAVILGFSELPGVGSVVSSAEKANKREAELAGSRVSQGVSVPEGNYGVFIKSKTAGSLEALLGVLPPKITVVGSGVGDVSESDVLYAKSAGVSIFTFESGAGSQVARLAEMEDVKIETFKIIYELIQRLEKILKGEEKEVLGQAQILASFPFDNRRVAGSKVTSGVIRRSDSLTLMRGEVVLGKVKIKSLRRMKNEIQEAKVGEELGILFEPQFDFAPGDVLVSHSK